MRTQVYTMSEFFNKDKIEELSKLDRAIGHIKRNKKTYIKLILITALLFTPSEVQAMVKETGIEKINRTGKLLFEYAQTFAYWAISIMLILECGKEAFRGGVHNISSVISKYIILAAATFACPWLLDLVRSIFQ